MKDDADGWTDTRDAARPILEVTEIETGWIALLGQRAVRVGGFKVMAALVTRDNQVSGLRSKNPCPCRIAWQTSR